MFTWSVTPPLEDKTCRVIGIDLGPIKPIWWESKPIDKIQNGDIIVLKIPGSSQWQANWQPFKYYGAYFQVLRVLERKENYEYFVGNGTLFKCEEVIAIPLRKKDNDAG